MADEQQDQPVDTEPEMADSTPVEPETGRCRSSEVIGGRRSPLEDAASERAGTLIPTRPQDNDERTGKKISQWGASARRRSYWKSRFY